MKKNPNMLDKMAGRLARLLQRELDSICPEESMSRWLDEGCGDQCIKEVRYEDGLIRIDVAVYPKGFYDEKNPPKMKTLTLKPVGWEKKKNGA